MSSIVWDKDKLIQQVGGNTKELGHVKHDESSNMYILWLKTDTGYIRGDSFTSMNDAKQRAAFSASVFLLHYMWMTGLRKTGIALDDFAKLAMSERIILCEGEPGRDGFDARCYNNIFSTEKPDTLFVSTGGKGSLKNSATIVRNTSKNPTVLTLRDKDHLTETGRQEAITKTDKVLSRKNIEEYLLDDEILTKLCEEKGNSDAMSILQKARDKHVNAKSSVNDIRNSANKKFHTNPVGDNANDFLINTMSKLITPDMQVYKELKRDIFEE